MELILIYIFCSFVLVITFTNFFCVQLCLLCKGSSAFGTVAGSKSRVFLIVQ